MKIYDAETGGLPEIPESFRITVRSDDGAIIWREVIQHHEKLNQSPKMHLQRFK